LNIVISWTGWK